MTDTSRANLPTNLRTNSIDAAVDHLLAVIPGEIVLGLPLGIGKPNPFVNALTQRIQALPERRLRIITALSLEKPIGKSDLERHFLEPLVERVFADYPDLDYVKDVRAGTLPANITVHEFFLKTGDYLHNEVAQQNYICTNYTFVARDLAIQGVNVMAQAVASNGNSEAERLSLSSNPDVTLALVENALATGQPLLVIGVINQQMPFMPNTAEVPADFFDVIVNDPAATHALFAPPNGKISTTDYAIGLHASSFVADGGTLQIGIGALGDAIAQALIVRNRSGDAYQQILVSLCADGVTDRELGRFEQGLYGCSEMFVNGFLELIQADIVRREVFDDLIMQQIVNRRRVDEYCVTSDTLRALLDAGRIPAKLRVDDLAFLKNYGILSADVAINQHQLVCAQQVVDNDLANPVVFDFVVSNWLGTRLNGGKIMSGGFFIGPRDFYENLRTMAQTDLAKIDMTRIAFINQLYGDENLKRAQRRNARFFNTTMMVTLLGAAVSDAIEPGRVVSGVGGQYNFVAMSHALPDAKLLMMLRATYLHKVGLQSSIVWDAKNVTIPRHLRDMVITEYGVADLRGQADDEVIKRLLAIADSRFQPNLLNEAITSGKLAADYKIPARYTNNLPSSLEEKLTASRRTDILPDFPFGTDLTDDEQHMARALKRMKRASSHPAEIVTLVIKGLWQGKTAPKAYLDRLGLAEGNNIRKMFLRILFTACL